MYYHRDARLIYLAHPRTASNATVEALLSIGFKTHERHHGGICDAMERKQWYVFTTVRNHFDTAVSWVLRRTRDRRGWSREIVEWALTEPVNRWVWESEMWGLHGHDSDEVLKYETLQGSLNALLNRFDLPSVELPRKNETQHRRGRHYHEFFDEDSRAYIEERFGEEMKRYGYKF